MREVADEHNLQFSLNVPTAPGAKINAPALPQANNSEQNEVADLDARLEALKK